jgi:preprotein translocase subunit SecA
MLDMIKNEVVRHVMTVRIQSREEIDAAEAAMQATHLENVHYQHADFNPDAAPEELLAPSAAPAAAADDGGLRVGRNDPCPCGSGKKFKACHGKLA